MKSAGKARNNGLYRHIRTSKEIIRNLLNDYLKFCPSAACRGREPFYAYALFPDFFSRVKTSAVISAVSGMDRITPTLLATPLTTSRDT